MRSSRLLLLVFIAICCSLPECATADDSQRSDMLVPGGLPVIAKATGLDPGFLKSPSATEQTFTYLLDSGPPLRGLSQVNPARRRLLDYVKAYNKFSQYLRKESLAPAGWDNSKPGEKIEISIQLSGGSADAEKIRKLFACFGSDYQPGASDDSAGRGSAVFPGILKRQDLLNAPGINLQGKQNREIRITLQSCRLPLLPNAQIWDTIVPGEKSDPLFTRFLENPDAMRLYVGLASYAPSVQEAVLNSMNSVQLLRSADLFYLFGSRLKVENGEICFPGSNRSWEGMLGLRDGAIASSIQALLKNNGLPLLLYNSLASAPVSVQAQITDSPEQLRSYYDVLKPFGSERIPGTPSLALSQDLTRILRQVEAGPHGLRFAIEDRIARALVRHVAPDRLEESPAGYVLFTPGVLARLLPLPKSSPYTRVSFGSVLELLRYLEDTHPEMLADKSLSVLLETPEQAPWFLDLIGDIAPGPPILSQYLNYCRMLASDGPQGWNVNRTRTSQSIFFLISALAHENLITRCRAVALLDEALQSFQADDEGRFARAVAEFLSSKLLPEISKRDPNPHDPLLYALSGQRQTDSIMYEGSEIPINRTEKRLQRMRETVQFQSYTPLVSMLEIYSTVRRIESADSSAAMDEMLRLLSGQLNGIKAAGWTPGGVIDKTKSIPESQPNKLKRLIEKMGSWSDPRADAAASARALSALLHAELSVSLLAYCYAYTEASGLDVLTYDPNFIRKHRFYRSILEMSPRWGPARFEQDENVGGYIVGSLAGLGFELGRLQIAQASREFSNEQETYLASAILFSSRQIPRRLRTDRSQEYVALMTRLGNELVHQPSDEEQVHSWLHGHLASLIPPKRIEEFETTAGSGDGEAVRGIFTRSELFLIGQAYFESERIPQSNPRGPGCLQTILKRLNSIVPRPGSDGYRKLRQEVEQYGILLSSRIGLSELSFRMMDSYEQLENNLRPQYLYDRLCDLKIRLAELNYKLGLPAALAEFETEFAMRDILSRAAPPFRNTWRQAEETINMFTEQDVRGWIQEIRSSGGTSAAREIVPY